MSRSYKKTPIVKYVYSNTLKSGKKLSNKRIRKHEDLSNGGQFKKILNTRYIYELKIYKPFQRSILENEDRICRNYRMYESFEKAVERWQRNYYRK